MKNRKLANIEVTIQDGNKLKKVSLPIDGKNVGKLYSESGIDITDDIQVSLYKHSNEEVHPNCLKTIIASQGNISFQQLTLLTDKINCAKRI